MKQKMFGAIPDHVLSSMIGSGGIKGVKQKHINPASLNLPLTEEMWRIERFILPEFGEKIGDLIRGKYRGRPHNFSHPLEVGVQYLIRLKVALYLEKVYGFFNPRSTTGRTFLNVRVVADGVPRYDSLPSNFDGSVWLLVKNDIFPCLLLEDDELVQLRMFYSDTRLDEVALRKLYQRKALLSDASGKQFPYSDLAIRDNDGSLVMTLSIPKGELAGWKTKVTSRPVKFSKENKASNFFEKVFSEDGTLDLDDRTGLILSTKEVLWVPDTMAAEGVRVDDRAGNYMSHRAGYFDPGFRGTITLEITGANETIRDGTSALKVKYEKLSSKAKKPYAAGYSGKTIPVLGKNFV